MVTALMSITTYRRHQMIRPSILDCISILSIKLRRSGSFGNPIAAMLPKNVENTHNLCKNLAIHMVPSDA
jgi:hypothetical protein